MTATTTRKSVPLDDGDLTRIEALTEDAVLADILARRIAGQRRITSESQLMHALVVYALDALDREADEQRYAALAAAQDDEDRAFHTAMRTRRGR